ncbi:PREDICTED: pentatricopeptide repeat-containing protein At3g13150 [Tarenaya hassleriana]|uniref:pentatricopeptide repeat-containing protein At3g13150 n=1 Tax=Tarenaya hassleriana TaxID=28532 RepID=UPI00053C7BFD|nr:PREDICTED: pentatricopeptide repeat-containing protein At3g13150 [Tarenaya hassleriana]
MSKSSSSLYSRLHGIFNSSPTATLKPARSPNRSKPRNLVGKPKEPSASPASAAAAGDSGKSSIDAKEKTLRKQLEKFKKSCESDDFRQVHGIYSAFVRRLKGERKFSMIDEALQYQKKFEDIKSEDFVIRMMLLYGYSGMADQAHKLFDEMPELNCERTIKSFNALLSAYVNSRKYDEAMKVLREFPEKLGITPDLVSYNTMIKAFCRKGSSSDVLSIFEELETNGFEPDLITFNTMFEAFYSKGWISEGDKLWDLMESRSLVPNIRSYNSRVRGLVKNKKIPDAVSLVDEMRGKGISPDIHTYNALISAYRGDDNVEEVMRCYEELKEKGHRPDAVTYCLIIPFLCQKGDLDRATEVSKEAIKRKILSRPDMFKPAIQGLVDQGKVDEAMELVKKSKLQGYFRYISDLPINKK